MRDLEVDLRDLKIARYCKERAGLRAYIEIIAIKAIERAIKAEDEVERLKLMVKSITEGLDEAIETNQYLGKQLDKAIEDIEILCTKHYELADDYDKLSDICQDFCLHTEGKCFKAAADNPNRCAKFRWRG